MAPPKSEPGCPQQFPDSDVGTASEPLRYEAGFEPARKMFDEGS